ncbi:MAG: hypothetical protein R2828_24665 [Saprospiraceae bacterium]
MATHRRAFNGNIKFNDNFNVKFNVNFNDNFNDNFNVFCVAEGLPQTLHYLFPSTTSPSKKNH